MKKLDNKAQADWKAGDRIGGYTVKGRDTYPFRKADLITLEHEKSGAGVLIIDCDDTDRAFGVALRTMAENDKGIPHIFEHSTLAGSGKYPSANLVFEMMQRTYSTYLNAGTYQHVTVYPASSLSEDQLLMNLDVYMSGITDPVVLKDPRGMMREAFRYVLHSPEEDPVPTGAVYNEMKGNFGQILNAAMHNLQADLFPDSVLGTSSGGIPDEVLKVTWDELKAFHDAYYHPSNMLIILYGKLHAERFLQFLDGEYLSRYDRRETRLPEWNPHPFSGFRETQHAHPVPSDTNPEKGSVLMYGIALNGMTLYEQQMLEVLCTAFNLDSSGLKRRISERLPGASLETGIYGLPVPIFYFLLLHADESDRGTFLSIIRESVEEVAAQGVDREVIEMMIHDLKISTMLEAEGSGGTDLIADFAVDWASTGCPTAYLEECRAMQELDSCLEKGLFDNLIRTRILNPGQAVLAVTVPEIGGAERAEEAFSKRMREYKASLSEAGVEELIRANADFDAWEAANGEISLIDRVSAVKLKDLPEEPQKPDLTDRTGPDGVRFLTSVIPEAQYLDITLYLDASGIPGDLLPELNLYTALLGELGTEEHTREEIEKRIQKLLYHATFGLVNIRFREGGYRAAYKVEGTALPEKMDEVWTLLGEILLKTDLHDPARIRDLAERKAAEARMKAKLSPHLLGFNVGRAAVDPDYRYDYCTGGFALWNYLDRVAAMTDAELEETIRRMEQIRGMLLLSGGLTVCLAGGKESILSAERHAEALAGELRPGKPDGQSYEDILQAPSMRTAVYLEGEVQYNVRVAMLRDLGCGYTDRMRVLASAAVSHILLPELRFRRGAYSVFCSFSDICGFLISYRDPNCTETFETFRTLGEQVRSLALTEQDLEGVILACYSDIARMKSPLDLALDTFRDCLSHRLDFSRTARYMKELKSMTLQDIRDMSVLFDRMDERGSLVCVGNPAVIREHADLFDQVITDLLD